jgi:hypothetical protein
LVCLCVYSVCVVLRLDSGLAPSWSPVQGVLPSVKLSKWRNNLDTLGYKRNGFSNAADPKTPASSFHASASRMMSVGTRSCSQGYWLFRWPG